jgi:hypothetical protein
MTKGGAKLTRHRNFKTTKNKPQAADKQKERGRHPVLGEK